MTYDETDLNEDIKKHARGDISFIQNLVPTDNGPMDNLLLTGLFKDWQSLISHIGSPG